MDRVMKRKKTSSKEFLENFDKIWREGPKIKYNYPECRLSTRGLLTTFKPQKTDSDKGKQLRVPTFKSEKSDFDKIRQLKIKGKVKGLSKIFNAPAKTEVRIEVVRALTEVGSVDALIALHGFSNIPTDSPLHDEIMKQLSRAMDSYIEFQRGHALIYNHFLLKKQ